MIRIVLQKKLRSTSGAMLLAIDLTIEKGEFVTLYGKSGAGKTSVLRMLAGLLKPDNGRVVVDNEILFDNQKKINLKPQDRKIGLLFQDYALFPNMTAKENLQFALRRNQEPGIIAELIDIMELGDLQNRKPNTFSGGEKQRVALARALVQKPKLLLLDEPLSALDIEMRNKLQDYILQVQEAYGLTMILVSHDAAEIMKMSDKVFYIEKGEIIAEGTAKDILNQQNNLELIGEIVAINKQTLNIRVGTVMIKINTNKKQIRSLAIGDKIVINANLIDINKID